MPSEKEPVFMLQLVMVARSDLSDAIESPCEKCYFMSDCPFSEFVIVECPIQEKLERV